MPQIDFTTWSYFNILTLTLIFFTFTYALTANLLLASHKLLSIRCHMATLRCLSVIARLLAANAQDFRTRKSWLKLQQQKKTNSTNKKN